MTDHPRTSNKVTEQVAQKQRESCAEKLEGSIRQLRRYLDGEKKNVRILQQKIDKVDVDKEALITSHHTYCVKANIEVSDPAAREYINEKIDVAIDIIDLAEEEIDELNDNKTTQEEARETVLELSKSRSLVTSHTAIVQEALQELTLHIAKQNPEESDASYAVSLIKDIHEREQELITSWNAVRSLLTVAAEITVVDNQENAFRKTIYDACAKGQLFISGIRSTVEVDDAASNASSNNTNNSHRTTSLAKMPPPKFSGNIRDFARFKSDFETIVTPDSPSEYHTLYTLKERCLVGEAHEIVKNLNDIDSAWERLSDRYGNEINIVDSINHDLSKLTIPKQNSDKGLIEFVNILERGVQDLESIKCEGEIANALTVRVIEKKLPPRVLRKWFDMERAEAGDERFKQLMKFLKQERRQVEQMVLQRLEVEAVTGGSGGGRSVHAT